MMRIKARYSSISNIIVTSNGFIILETYGPKVNDKPLLYKIDLKGNLVWETKHPVPSASQFCNLILKDKKVIVHDGSGETDVNPDTGELTNWILTR